MDFRNTQRTGTQARVLPDGAASNRVFRDVPRDAASLPSPGKRTRHGERGMKDTAHFLMDAPFTSSVNGSLEDPRGCAWRDIRFGRGQKSDWAGATPPLGAFQPPKDFVGSLQPSVRKESALTACFARARRRETSNEPGGIKCQSTISNPQS